MGEAKQQRTGVRLGGTWAESDAGKCTNCGLPRFAHGGEFRKRCPADEAELEQIEAQLGGVLKRWSKLVEPVIV
ncbi:MAG: hypothetical protein ACF8TS_05705, partial [Maioricimonas sp. JB049]